MRILFDLAHPAHVNFFKNVICRLNSSKEYEVFVTCLKRGKLPLIVKDELEGLDITYIGKHRGTFYSIIVEANLIKFIKLLLFIFNKRIDFGISVGSFTLGAALKFKNKPNIQFDDDPESKQNIFFEKLTATKIITPPVISRPSKKFKIFNALKEWAYLSPKYFTPDKSVLKDYGLTAKKYIFIREVSTGSLNYTNQDDNIVLSFANNITSNIPVILSLEDKTVKEKYPAYWKILQEPVKDIHSIIYYSKAVISSGDSMAREGAMLGVPSIYCGIRKMAANKVMIDKGMLFHKNVKDITHLVKRIINNDIKIEEQDKFRKKLKDEWVDVTEFIIRQIKKYG